jgi:hypothetical protein
MATSRGRGAFLLGLGTALAAGWGLFPRVLYERIEQPLQFSHSVHAGEDVGLACDDCHYFEDDGQFTGIPSVSMCADCHEEPLGESEAERRLVEEYVTPGKEIPWLVYSRQPDNTRFPHAEHVVLAELECATCHGDHGATDSLRPYERNRVSGYSRDIWGRSMTRLRNAEWEGMKMGDCSGCHRKNEVVESCLDCHR